MLLTRLVDSGSDTGASLDETVMLGKLAGWRGWPAGRADAIDGYLHAVWRALLSTHPTRTGSLTDAHLPACGRAGPRRPRRIPAVVGAR